jgi:hypothetical protein
MRVVQLLKLWVGLQKSCFLLSEEDDEEEELDF